ncbi:unnamed protein product, partial [Parascedosporium putredinis]
QGSSTTPAAEDDPWAMPAKKGKKKKGRQAAEFDWDKPEEQEQEQEQEKEAAPPPAAEDDPWAMPAKKGKKGKKKGKKMDDWADPEPPDKGLDDSEETGLMAKPDDAEQMAQEENIFATPKKKKKGGKKKGKEKAVDSEEIINMAASEPSIEKSPYSEEPTATTLSTNEALWDNAFDMQDLGKGESVGDVVELDPAPSGLLKKEKRKKKKASQFSWSDETPDPPAVQTSEEPLDEQPIVAALRIPEQDTTPTQLVKGKKKKNKGSQRAWDAEEEEPANRGLDEPLSQTIDPPPAREAVPDGVFASSKTKRSKGKKASVTEQQGIPSTGETEALDDRPLTTDQSADGAAHGDSAWDDFNADENWADAMEELEIKEPERSPPGPDDRSPEASISAPEPLPAEDDFGVHFNKKSKKKKGKKNDKTPFEQAPESDDAPALKTDAEFPVPGPMPTVTDSTPSSTQDQWDTPGRESTGDEWSAPLKSKAKKEKGKKRGNKSSPLTSADEPTLVEDETPAVEQTLKRTSKRTQRKTWSMPLKLTPLLPPEVAAPPSEIPPIEPASGDAEYAYLPKSMKKKKKGKAAKSEPTRELETAEASFIQGEASDPSDRTSPHLWPPATMLLLMIGHTPPSSKRDKKKKKGKVASFEHELHPDTKSEALAHDDLDPTISLVAEEEPKVEDEWAYTPPSKKGKKKGKAALVESEPLPETEPEAAAILGQAQDDPASIADDRQLKAEEDDWAFTALSKKDKKKKGKAKLSDPTPPPEAELAGETTLDQDANPLLPAPKEEETKTEDDWSYTTPSKNLKKKKKKDKSSPADSELLPETVPDAIATSTQGKDSVTSLVGEDEPEVEDDGFYASPPKTDKRNKKGKGIQSETDKTRGLELTEPHNEASLGGIDTQPDEDWSSSLTEPKKGKKNKKTKLLIPEEDSIFEPHTSLAGQPIDEETRGDGETDIPADEWSTTRMDSKDKKKKKKKSLDLSEPELQTDLQNEPAHERSVPEGSGAPAGAEIEPVPEPVDDWAFTPKSKKIRPRKRRRDTQEQAARDITEDSRLVTGAPGAEPADHDTFTSTSENDTMQERGMNEDQALSTPESEPEVSSMSGTTPAEPTQDSPEEKKKSRATLEPKPGAELDVEPPPRSEPDLDAEIPLALSEPVATEPSKEPQPSLQEEPLDQWNFTPTSKKDKKKKKKGMPAIEPEPPAEGEPDVPELATELEPTLDLTAEGEWEVPTASGKDKKKKKKKGLATQQSFFEPESSYHEQPAEFEPATGEALPPPEHIADRAADRPVEDDWVPMSSSKKDKKKKKKSSFVLESEPRTDSGDWTEDRTEANAETLLEVEPPALPAEPTDLEYCEDLASSSQNEKDEERAKQTGLATSEVGQTVDAVLEGETAIFEPHDTEASQPLDPVTVPDSVPEELESEQPAAIEDELSTESQPTFNQSGPSSSKKDKKKKQKGDAAFDPQSTLAEAEPRIPGLAPTGEPEEDPLAEWAFTPTTKKGKKKNKNKSLVEQEVFDIAEKFTPAPEESTPIPDSASPTAEDALEDEWSSPLLTTKDKKKKKKGKANAALEPQPSGDREAASVEDCSPLAELPVTETEGPSAADPQSENEWAFTPRSKDRKKAKKGKKAAAISLDAASESIPGLDTTSHISPESPSEAVLELDQGDLVEHAADNQTPDPSMVKELPQTVDESTPVFEQQTPREDIGESALYKDEDGKQRSPVLSSMEPESVNFTEPSPMDATDIVSALDKNPDPDYPLSGDEWGPTIFDAPAATEAPEDTWSFTPLAKKDKKKKKKQKGMPSPELEPVSQSQFSLEPSVESSLLEPDALVSPIGEQDSLDIPADGWSSSLDGKEKKKKKKKSLTSQVEREPDSTLEAALAAPDHADEPNTFKDKKKKKKRDPAEVEIDSGAARPDASHATVDQMTESPSPAILGPTTATDSLAPEDEWAFTSPGDDRQAERSKSLSDPNLEGGVTEPTPARLEVDETTTRAVLGPVEPIRDTPEDLDADLTFSASEQAFAPRDDESFDVSVDDTRMVPVSEDEEGRNQSQDAGEVELVEKGQKKKKKKSTISLEEVAPQSSSVPSEPELQIYDPPQEYVLPVQDVEPEDEWAAGGSSKKKKNKKKKDTTFSWDTSQPDPTQVGDLPIEHAQKDTKGEPSQAEQIPESELAAQQAEQTDIIKGHPPVPETESNETSLLVASMEPEAFVEVTDTNIVTLLPNDDGSVAEPAESAKSAKASGEKLLAPVDESHTPDLGTLALDASADTGSTHPVTEQEPVLDPIADPTPVDDDWSFEVAGAKKNKKKKGKASREEVQLVPALDEAELINPPQAFDQEDSASQPRDTPTSTTTIPAPSRPSSPTVNDECPPLADENPLPTDSRSQTSHAADPTELPLHGILTTEVVTGDEKLIPEEPSDSLTQVYPAHDATVGDSRVEDAIDDAEEWGSFTTKKTKKKKEKKTRGEIAPTPSPQPRPPSADVEPEPTSLGDNDKPSTSVDNVDEWAFTPKKKGKKGKKRETSAVELIAPEPDNSAETLKIHQDALPSSDEIPAASPDDVFETGPPPTEPVDDWASTPSSKKSKKNKKRKSETTTPVTSRPLSPIQAAIPIEAANLSSETQPDPLTPTLDEPTESILLSAMSDTPIVQESALQDAIPEEPIPTPLVLDEVDVAIPADAQPEKMEQAGKKGKKGKKKDVSRALSPTPDDVAAVDDAILDDLDTSKPNVVLSPEPISAESGNQSRALEDPTELDPDNWSFSPKNTISRTRQLYRGQRHRFRTTLLLSLPSQLIKEEEDWGFADAKKRKKAKKAKSKMMDLALQPPIDEPPPRVDDDHTVMPDPEPPFEGADDWAAPAKKRRARTRVIPSVRDTPEPDILSPPADFTDPIQPDADPAATAQEEDDWGDRSTHIPEATEELSLLPPVIDESAPIPETTGEPLEAPQSLIQQAPAPQDQDEWSFTAPKKAKKGKKNKAIATDSMPSRPSSPVNRQAPILAETFNPLVESLGPQVDDAAPTGQEEMGERFTTPEAEGERAKEPDAASDIPAPNALQPLPSSPVTEPMGDQVAAVALPVPEIVEAEPVDDWAFTSSKKNKGKKGKQRGREVDAPVPVNVSRNASPTREAETEVVSSLLETTADDEWGSLPRKKSKKKGKKDKVAQYDFEEESVGMPFIAESADRETAAEPASKALDFDLTPAQAISHIIHEAPYERSPRPEKKLRVDHVEETILLSEPILSLAEPSSVGRGDDEHWDESRDVDLGDGFLGAGPSKYDDSFMEDVYEKPQKVADKKPREAKSKGKGKEVEAAATAAPAVAAAVGAVSSLAQKFGGQVSRPKKKQKAKKIVDKRGDREPDLFDDPVLWETSDRKTLLGEEVPGEVDAFWGGGKNEVLEQIGEGPEVSGNFSEKADDLDFWGAGEDDEPRMERGDEGRAVGDRKEKAGVEEGKVKAVIERVSLDVVDPDSETRQPTRTFDEAEVVEPMEEGNTWSRPVSNIGEVVGPIMVDVVDFEEEMALELGDKEMERSQPTPELEIGKQTKSGQGTDPSTMEVVDAREEEVMEASTQRGIVGKPGKMEISASPAASDVQPAQADRQSRGSEPMIRSRSRGFDDSIPEVVAAVAPDSDLGSIISRAESPVARQERQERHRSQEKGKHVAHRSEFSPSASVSRSLGSDGTDLPTEDSPPVRREVGEARHARYTDHGSSEKQEAKSRSFIHDILDDSSLGVDPAYTPTRRSLSRGLEPVPEEPTLGFTPRPAKKKDRPVSALPPTTPDIGREGGLIVDSPHDRRRGNWAEEGPHRDSGVHLKDWSDTPRGQSPERRSFSARDRPHSAEKAERQLRRSPLGYRDLHDHPLSKAPMLREPSSRHGTPEPEKTIRRAAYTPTPEDSSSSKRLRRVASNTSLTRHRTPEPHRFRPDTPGSIRSLHSATPPLRRVDRRISGDLRSLSQRNQGGQVGEPGSARAESSSKTRSLDHTQDLPSAENTNPVANEGRVRSKDMTDVYDGFGEGRIGSPRSPTRPHSMRRRQSMQVLELESKVKELIAENQLLHKERQTADQTYSQNAHSLLSDRDSEIDALKRSLELLNREVSRLTEVNAGLTAANTQLANEHNGRYRDLELLHASAARELETSRSTQGSFEQRMHDKDVEIAELRTQLESAQAKFDHRCQQLCQHVQQWVLRFSKFSDMRACRLTGEINDEKIIDRLDNSILDGSDVDVYLQDRVRRRDVFMSMTMNMIWEFIFTRYLFGMDREQRQKLKSLEKHLTEIGPTHAVRLWRAVTLTLLSRRESFKRQRDLDTEAVVQAILETLQLRRVMAEAVDLAIMMRTQRAEYMMLPPLQPEYNPDGELVETVTFNAALMNERGGDKSTTNEELQAQGSIVRVVLFPLVVRKGDDMGVGEDEIVVCPAQVLVARSSRRKSRQITPRVTLEASRSARLRTTFKTPASLTTGPELV